jgi:hypothetical protein
VDLILLFVVAWALSNAWRDVRGQVRTDREKRVSEAAKKIGAALTPARRKRLARQHDLAWTAREVMTGFPVTRTAWHSAWLAHRTAAVHQKARREELRTAHLEAGTSVAAGMAEHKRRQAEIRAEAERIKAGIDDAVAAAPEPAVTRKAVRQAAGNVIAVDFPRTSPDRPYAPAGTASNDGWPAGVPHKRKTSPATEGAPMADPRSSDGWIDVDEMAWNRENIPGINGAGTQNYPGRAIGRSRPTTSKGASVAPAAEMTYDQTQSALRRQMSEQEAIIASLQASRVGAMVDTLAGAGLDSGTLGRLADVSDAHAAQIKAAQAVYDGLEATSAGLQRDHGSINEAIQSAPVPAADTGFYDG